MDIIVGAPAVSGTGNLGYSNTTLDKSQPATGTGKITLINVHIRVGGSQAIPIGIFYLVSGSIYRCRSATVIGPYTSAGLKTALVDLAVAVGDFIGCYTGTHQGRITLKVSANYDLWWVYELNLCIVGAQGDFSTKSKHLMSLRGEGQTPPVSGRLFAGLIDEGVF